MRISKTGLLSRGRNGYFEAREAGAEYVPAEDGQDHIKIVASSRRRNSWPPLELRLTVRDADRLLGELRRAIREGQA